MKNLFSNWFLSASALFLLASSCSKEPVIINTQNEYRQRTARITASDKEISALKKEFGAALAKALKESSSLRSLVKNKALERIDEDYDVLYQLIKKERLENGITVRELIAKHLKNKGQLQVIEANLPTLTIFVPDLPKGSFSAQSWNTEKQIPVVGIRLLKSNDVPVIDAEGNETLVESGLIPGYPIVVVKESVRIVDNSHSNYNEKNTRKLLRTEEGMEFKFLDNAFDHSLNVRKKGARFWSAPDMAPKVVDAYNIFLNTDNWQRDHIYYGMTTTVDKGAFNYDHEETITSLRFTNAQSAYNLISDQTDDPNQSVTDSPSQNQNAYWTGGSYTFKVTTLVNGRNGIGNEIVVYFPAQPTEVFELLFQPVYYGSSTYYRVSEIIPKTMSLNSPIFKWDLYQYSTSIKISVEEVDTPTSTTTTESTVANFSANFGVDDGIFKKLGLKFGATASTQSTVTYAKTITQGNDNLGDAVINFADKVVLNYYPSNPGVYSTNEYLGGYLWMTIEPRLDQ